MPAEVFVNVGESTLAAPALSTDTTLTLLSGAPFPAAGQYRIRLDDSLQQPSGIATRYEICRATFNAGNVVNLFRTGADLEGTTAQGWPIGTAVRAIVTAAALANIQHGGSAQFLVQASGTFTVGGVSINVVSTLTSVVFDYAGGFAGYTYTIPIAGVYQFNFGAYALAQNATQLFAAALYRNGARVNYGTYFTARGSSVGDSLISTGSALVPCAVGDTIQLAASNGSTPNGLPIQPGVDTFLSGAKVG